MAKYIQKTEVFNLILGWRVEFRPLIIMVDGAVFYDNSGLRDSRKTKIPPFNSEF